MFLFPIVIYFTWDPSTNASSLFLFHHTGLELYFVLVVYSYYQIMCQSTRMVSVNVPVVAYTVHPHDQLNMYPQPPVNPYLFQAPKYPYQYENGTNKYAYNPNSYPNPDHLPPPYGTWFAYGFLCDYIFLYDMILYYVF